MGPIRRDERQFLGPVEGRVSQRNHSDVLDPGAVARSARVIRTLAYVRAGGQTLLDQLRQVLAISAENAVPESTVDGCLGAPGGLHALLGSRCRLA